MCPDPNLLLGYDTSDDAAVYRLSDELAAVLTVDFFTPMVDDPYIFGRIAAANALSDIYAMGARPVAALNLLAFPPALGAAAAADVLRGGRDAVAQAGASVAGGHTIEDDEPKYGLAVMGLVHPERIMLNSGAQAGDVLYYTKPLGIGIIMAALKAGLQDEQGAAAVLEAMMTLNDHAATAMLAAGAHAATDVTGFGLVGHLHELLAASGQAAILHSSALPTFDGVLECSAAFCRPGKSFEIINWAEPFLTRAIADDDCYENLLGVICDPQTSGGLLVALAPQQQQLFVRTFAELAGYQPWKIGEVISGQPGQIILAQQAGEQ
ncbi:MAG: selenide, water dikinase SelD [Coriobacteriales bacterium]|jgi:selenide,water dikinase|nr:selenide, water dikinase SelD [Coriobacteriales bacterium]